MIVNLETGLLSGVPFEGSPNFHLRPDPGLVDLLVIHGISLPPGRFEPENIRALFLNQLNPKAHPYFKAISHLKVSSHLVIHRDGSVVQFVPFTQAAWHAGVSAFKGRMMCNDFSIGIELVGTDTTPYTDIQYERLYECTKAIQVAYPLISSDHIVGHCHIAPDRKTDPGDIFDWKRYKQQLNQLESKII